MAWRNATLAMADVPQSLINDFSWCDNIVIGSSKVTFNGINPVNSGLTDGFPIGDANNGLKISTADQWTWNGEIFYNNANIYSGSYWTLPKTEEYSGTKISFIACVNDETQKGIFLLLKRWRDTNDWDTNFNPYYSTSTGDAITYRFITANEPMSTCSGGAGSGYIGNVLLSNKKMVGYNVPTSSAEGTYTESVNEASEPPVANKPKIGNGFARIKLLRAASDISFFTSSLSSDLMVEDWDVANVKDSLTYGNPTMQPTMYSEFFLTEWNFNIGNEWAPSTTISNGELVRTGRGDNRSDSVFWIPINRINKTIIKITADYKVTDQRHWGSGFDRIGFWVGYVDANNEWRSVSLGNKYPDDENWHTGGEWVYNGTLIPYIDYIGIEGGDGIYHAKNIVLTVG